MNKNLQEVVFCKYTLENERLKTLKKVMVWKMNFLSTMGSFGVHVTFSVYISYKLRNGIFIKVKKMKKVKAARRFEESFLVSSLGEGVRMDVPRMDVNGDRINGLFHLLKKWDILGL